MASAPKVQSRKHVVVHYVHGLIQENCEEEKGNLAREAMQNTRTGSMIPWQTRTEQVAKIKKLVLLE